MSLQKVGRYEIVSELGRGAMGVVYKAQDPNIGRTVALKTMRLDVHGLETEDMLRRFKNEARAAGVLNHPHIVTIYDAGEHEGVFYIAMEFIEGVTLHEMLAENRALSSAQTIQIAGQICQGLDYAHSMGIVHRDVKPANIMMTANGAVKIMDFGIAKAGGGMTSTGQIVGTPHYMSPEQVKGRMLDGRSDLFSMGVVLYEMVTGEKPFVGQNVTTVIYKIVHETPISPRDLDVTVHPGLSEVVTKALAKSPDERYQTGAELARDLENYKSLGAAPGSTAVLPISAGQTQALPRIAAAPAAVMPLVAETPETTARAGNGATAATAAAPAKAKSSPERRPSTTVVMQAKTRNVLVAAIASILLIAGAAAAYGIHRYRAAVKLHEADVQLEQRIKAEEAQPSPTEAVQNAAAQSADTATRSATSNPQPVRSKALSAPAEHRGELDLASDPKGAKIQVDGRGEPQWITPFQVSDLPAGPHTVVFSRDGYQPETRNVEVVAGKKSPVSVQLNPSPSILAVASTPSGAGIWVDGQDTGKATPTQITLPPGEHKVLVRKPGFKEASATEILVAGETLNYSPVLPSLPSPQFEDAGRQGNPLKRFFGADSIPPGKGLLHIRTVPNGATIIVNGHVAPKKTDVSWPLAPGSYDVVLQITGYKSVRRTIQVREGKITNMDEFIEKQ